MDIHLEAEIEDAARDIVNLLPLGDLRENFLSMIIARIRWGYHHGRCDGIDVGGKLYLDAINKIDLSRSVNGATERPRRLS